MKTIYQFQCSDLLNPIQVSKSEFDYLSDIGAGQIRRGPFEVGK